MGMITPRCHRRAIVSEVKPGFSLRKCVDVEAIGVEIVCQVIGRKEINGGRKARFGANFQQALEHFKRCKAANRVSVGCHVFSASFASFECAAYKSCARSDALMYA